MTTKAKQICFFVISLLMMGFFGALIMLSISDHGSNAKMTLFVINVIGSIAGAGLAYSLVRKIIALSISAKILISVFVFLFPVKTILILLIAEIIILVVFLQPIQLRERQE